MRKEQDNTAIDPASIRSPAEAALQSYNWAQTPLGAIETWSDSLKTAIQAHLSQEIDTAFESPETLALRQAAEANAFRVRLNDALRSIADAEEIQAIAARVLGETLNASRVIYLEVSLDGTDVIVHRNYTNGVAELSGRYRLEDYRRNLSIDHQAGHIQVVTDIPNSSNYGDAEKARYREIDIAAHIDVPLIKNGQFVALLVVHQSIPRVWTEAEVRLVEETAERTWAAVERSRAEAALRESEAKYRTLFESIDEGYFIAEVIFDEDNRPIDLFYVEANPAAKRITGLDIVGRSLREINPNYEPHWWETYGKIVQTGIAERQELYAEPLKSWFSFYSFKVGGADSRRVAAVFQDITTRRQTEAALRQPEERYRTLFESIDEGFCIVEVICDETDTPIDYRVLETNPVFVHQTGLKDAIGKTAREMNLEEHWIETYGQVALTGESVRFENGSQVLNRWFDVYACRIGEPEARKVAIVFNDISDRKQAEVTIQARNDRLRLLATTASSLLLTLDPNAFLDRLFYEVAEHLQLEIYFNYLFDEPRQRLELNSYSGISDEVAESARFLKLGEAVCGYVVQQRRAVVVESALESTHPLALPVQSIGIRAYASHPLMIGDRVIGTLGLGTRQRDRFTQDELDLMQAVAAQVAAALERSQLITELQTRAEALDRANRIKDEFLAVLSHELRTPLNPILGWTKMLRNNTLDATRAAYALETIERNAQLQVQLIEDLLDISRILRGKLSLTVHPVDLGAVITAALETVRLAAEAKTIQVKTTIAPEVGIVMGDAGRLQQVVWNLLSNAVKFTPAGGQITVSLTQVGHQAQIQISDTGKGIQPDFLPYVFEHFRQEDAATTRKFGGLGLGLAIARQIVEIHGGSITAESSGEDQGSRFTVQIPIAASANLVSDSEATTATGGNLQGIRILIVEDEADSREFAAFVLEQAGAIVVQAASGTEALSAIAQSTPDLIISDIGMPEVDGYMLQQHLRAQGKEIPAIALTAYASDIDAQHSEQAGFRLHLSKPIDPNELVNAILNLQS